MNHWLMGGHFNIIQSLEKKKAGIRSLSGISKAFNLLIEELHLVDILTPNGFYTWKNKCLGKRHIASRLDRFLVSESIMNGEGDIGAFLLPGAGLDH